MRITRNQLRQIIQEELGRITEDTQPGSVEPVPAGLMAQALRDFPGKTEADLTYSPTEDGTGYTGFDRTYSIQTKHLAGGAKYWVWRLMVDGKLYWYEDHHTADCDNYYKMRSGGCDIAESENWFNLNGPPKTE